MTASPSERRDHARHSAHGTVIVRPSGEDGPEIQGILIDLSDAGFRISHDSPNLETGLLVDFDRAGASGQAKVIWNRILQGSVQTGFLVTRQTVT